MKKRLLLCLLCLSVALAASDNDVPAPAVMGYEVLGKARHQNVYHDDTLITYPIWAVWDPYLGPDTLERYYVVYNADESAFLYMAPYGDMGTKINKNMYSVFTEYEQILTKKEKYAGTLTLTAIRGGEISVRNKIVFLGYTTPKDFSMPNASCQVWPMPLGDSLRATRYVEKTFYVKKLTDYSTAKLNEIEYIKLTVVGDSSVHVEFQLQKPEKIQFLHVNSKQLSYAHLVTVFIDIEDLRVRVKNKLHHGAYDVPLGWFLSPRIEPCENKFPKAKRKALASGQMHSITAYNHVSYSNVLRFPLK